MCLNGYDPRLRAHYCLRDDTMCRVPWMTKIPCTFVARRTVIPALQQYMQLNIKYIGRISVLRHSFLEAHL